LTLALVGVLALACLAAEAGPVARVTSFNGFVKVERAGGVTAPIRKLGTQVRGGALTSGDIVHTGSGSSAEILFDDQSSIKMSPNSSLRIRQADATPTQIARSGKTVVRTMRLSAGKLAAHIRPSLSVATEFETPTGVAAVRGTRLIIEVAGQKYLCAVQDGEVKIYNIDSATGLATSETSLPAGCGVTVDVTATGAISVATTPGSGDVAVTTTDGVTYTLNEGEAIDVTSTTVTATSGTISNTGGADLAEGASTIVGTEVAAAVPEAPADAGADAGEGAAAPGGGAGGGGGGGSPEN